jgi:hypothetical protein
VTEPPLAEDDRALSTLGRRARDHIDARPRAWEAVACSERSEQEVAAERLAAGDAPEAVELARELFRPPDEAEHAAIVDALLAQQATRREAPPVVSIPTETAANDSRRTWLVGVVALAAAIALAWWLVPGSPVEPEPPVLAMAPIPVYELLETDGGLAAMRSRPVEPGAVLQYRSDTKLEWSVRPRVAAEGEIGARVFAFGEGKAMEVATDGLLEVHTSGAVRVAGQVASLGLTRGAWTIAIVVGRPAALPNDPAAVRDSEGSETWVVRRLRIVVED